MYDVAHTNLISFLPFTVLWRKGKTTIAQTFTDASPRAPGLRAHISRARMTFYYYTLHQFSSYSVVSGHEHKKLNGSRNAPCQYPYESPLLLDLAEDTRE